MSMRNREIKKGKEVRKITQVIKIEAKRNKITNKKDSKKLNGRNLSLLKAIITRDDLEKVLKDQF